jgi:hypothetical protein
MVALVIDREMKGGMSHREAEEIAVGEVLARGDGRATTEDPAPEPLSYREMEEIYKKLDARHNYKLRVVKGKQLHGDDWSYDSSPHQHVQVNDNGNDTNIRSSTSVTRVIVVSVPICVLADPPHGQWLVFEHRKFSRDRPELY